MYVQVLYLICTLIVEFQRKDIIILLELIVSCPFRTIIQLDNYVHLYQYCAQAYIHIHIEQDVVFAGEKIYLYRTMYDNKLIQEVLLLQRHFFTEEYVEKIIFLKKDEEP